MPVQQANMTNDFKILFMLYLSRYGYFATNLLLDSVGLKKTGRDDRYILLQWHQNRSA